MIARAWSRPSAVRGWIWWRSLLATGRRPEPPARPSLPATTAPPQARAADSDDFERFFLEHEAQISGYLWRMTGDAQSASDLSQETFLRAWQHFDKIRGYDRPAAWLIRVATNLAIQHLRRRSDPIGEATALDESITPSASDPSWHLAVRDLVRETLLELPPRPRAMLILREVYGLSGNEVAAALDMSADAVKVALWRARVQFRASYLRKDGQP